MMNIAGSEVFSLFNALMIIGGVILLVASLRLCAYCDTRAGKGGGMVIRFFRDVCMLIGIATPMTVLMVMVFFH